MNEKAFNPDPMFRQRKPIGTQPEAVAGLNREGSRRDLPEGDVRGRTSVLELMHRVVTALPETREPFWRVFTACARDLRTANNNLFHPPRLSQNSAANGDDHGRKDMEWFSQKTSIAGTQIPNWVIVLAVVIVLFLIYRFIT